MDVFVSFSFKVKTDHPSVRKYFSFTKTYFLSAVKTRYPFGDGAVNDDFLLPLRTY